jgi:hypothetical protein
MWDAVHRGFGASTMPYQHHLGSGLPNFLIIHPQPAWASQCKGGPTCPFIAYQSGKTLYTYHLDVECTPWGV